MNSEMEELRYDDAACYQPDVAYVDYTDKATMFFLALSNAHNFSELIVDKCPSMGEAVSMMTKPWFLQKLRQKMKVLVVNVRMSSLVEPMSENQLEKISDFYASSSIVIKIDTADDRFNDGINGNFLIYWKTSEIQRFLKLELPSTSEHRVKRFVAKFLIQSVNGRELGLSAATLGEFASLFEVNLELFSLADARGFDLLMIAAREGNEAVVNYLLGLGFDVNNSVNDETPASLAWKSKRFSTLLILLKANSLYPEDFHLHNATSELKEFVKVSERVHGYILRDQFEEIQEILVKNSLSRHFYNTRNVSAPALAAMRGKIEIYKLFLIHNVFISPKEDVSAIFHSIKSKHRESMRLIHLEHAKDCTQKHLMILLANSFVGHDINDADAKLNYVSDAFTFLNAIPLISLILRIVAASRDFKIIFDFNRENIQHMDPTADKNTRGIYYTTRHIYIAAKFLLCSVRQIEAYATIAHELCHFALHLVYKNLCLPYARDDFEKQTLFCEIARLCERNKSKEKFVAMVYTSYGSDFRHIQAELIVRVPHMIVLYDDNITWLKQCRANYRKLFQFYEKTTAPDMQRALPNIEVKAENDFQKFVDRRRMKKRGIRIHSALVIMNTVLLLAIFGFSVLFWSVGKEEKFGCKDLSDEWRAKLNESRVYYQGINALFGELYDKDECFALPEEITRRIIEPLKKNPQTNRSIPVLTLRQSIVFEEAMDFISRNLTELNERQMDHKFDSIKLNGGVTIIQGSIGEGKDSLLKYAANKLRRKDNWISKIKLKRIRCQLSTFAPQNTSENYLLDFLTDILKIPKEEKIIFEKNFRRGSTIFMWYGFDEIDSALQQHAVRLFKEIQKPPGSTQLLTMRPKGIDDLREQLNASAYRIAPYTESCRREFIVKAFRKTNWNQTFIDMKLKEIEDFIRPLSDDRMCHDHFEVLNTPLMLKYICDRQLTENSSLKFLNIYDFYMGFVNERLERNANKSDIILTDELKQKRVDQTMKVLEFFALKSLLESRKFIPDVTTRGHLNHADLEVNSSQFPNDLVYNGILIENAQHSYDFIHDTFVSLFVAKYFRDSLWALSDDVSVEEVRMRLKLLFFVAENVKHEFKIVNEFFMPSIAGAKSGYFSETVKDLMTHEFKYIFDSFYKNKLDSIRFLSKFFQKDPEILRTLWTPAKGSSFFFQYLRKSTDIEGIKSEMQSLFKQREVEKILKAPNQQLNILHAIKTTKKPNFTNLLLNVTGYEIGSDILTNLTTFGNFYDFINSSDFSTMEIREFYKLHAFDDIRDAKSEDALRQIIEMGERKAKIKVKDLLTEKSIIGNQTHLFTLINEKNVAKIQHFIDTLLRLHPNRTTADVDSDETMTDDEMRQFLTHKSSRSGETFITQAIAKATNRTNVRVLWGFVEMFVSEREAKRRMLVSKSEMKFFKHLLKCNQLEVFSIYAKIFKGLYGTEDIDGILEEDISDGGSLLDWIQYARSDVCEKFAMLIDRAESIDCSLLES